MSVLALASLLAVLSYGPIVGSLPPEPRAIPSFNPATTGDIGMIRSDIATGRREGSLSRRQARELRRESREIEMLEERYAAAGLSDDERAELRSRLEVLRALTNAKRLGTVR